MGIITVSEFKKAVILIPFMLIGLFAGMKSGSVLNDKVVKKIVIVLLIISGIMMIIKG